MFEILGNLTMAGRIQLVNHGYLAVKEVIENINTELLDWNLLGEEEIGEGRG